MRRGELWWANLGAHRPQEQTGRRPVIIWQSDALNSVLQSVLVVPLTTNLDRARLAGTAIISATPDGPPADSVALAFQMRAIPKTALDGRIRLEVKFREVERKQDEQRKKLDEALAFLAKNFVTDDELIHLQKLAARTPFPFHKSQPFEAELRRLLAFGLIGRRPGKGIRSLFKDGDDVQNHLEITTQGTSYLEHRRSLTSAEG